MGHIHPFNATNRGTYNRLTDGSTQKVQRKLQQNFVRSAAIWTLILIIYTKNTKNTKFTKHETLNAVMDILQNVVLLLSPWSAVLSSSSLTPSMMNPNTNWQSIERFSTIYYCLNSEKYQFFLVKLISEPHTMVTMDAVLLCFWFARNGCVAQSSGFKKSRSSCLC